jgi:hypothetical protein
VFRKRSSGYLYLYFFLNSEEKVVETLKA